MVSRARVWGSLGTLLALAAPLSLARAQPVDEAANVAAATPVRPLALIADSVAAFGDTARALAMLDSAIRKNPRDASLWHRLGLIQWERARSFRTGGVIWNSTAIRQLVAADTSLARAAMLAPDSGRYALDFSRFLLNSGWAPVRFGAQRSIGRAYNTAVRVGDNRLISDAATERGIVHWRRFENVGYRVLTRDGQPLQVDLSGPNTSAIDAVEQAIINIDQRPDENADLVIAHELFREALSANPDNMRARRHHYMVLAERGRWSELREDAQERIQNAPLDPMAWLALGLAEHRLGNSAAAMPAFDSAFVRLPQADFRRLTSLTRVLRPRSYEKKNRIADSAAFASLAIAEQEAMSRMYWLMADPLAITGANEHHAEFLARLAFAEIRWTQDDFGLKGADTDRGDIYIRYGPPDLQAGTPGSILWVYRNRLVFVFQQTPSFGTARIAFSDRNRVDHVRADLPVKFDNVPVTKLLDTIPTRVARFRAGGDSTDLVVSASIPFDSLMRNIELDRASVDVDVRTFDQFVNVHAVESSRTSVSADSARARTERFSTRVGPGTNVVRIEAYQADAKHGARAVVVVPEMSADGFDVSDILLSTRPVARPERGVARRWRDLNATPVTGSYRTGQPLGLVWEVYQLAANAQGDALYNVSIDIQRVTSGGLGRVVTRVLDGAGQAVGRESRRGRNRVTTSFSRRVRAFPVQLDYFTLDVSEFPPGDYKLTVEIHDTVANRRIRREDTFSIVP